MYSILFVCLGNICRSSAAETIFADRVHKAGAAAHFTLDSAGLIDCHEGEEADARMRSHAFAHGYRITHRSRPVTREDLQRFDLIVAMDPNNVAGLLKLARTAEEKDKIVEMAAFLTHHNERFIPDPYYGTHQDFEWVIELLEDACDGLLSHLLDHLQLDIRP